jgi:competence protein ComEC
MVKPFQRITLFFMLLLLFTVGCESANHPTRSHPSAFDAIHSVDYSLDNNADMTVPDPNYLKGPTAPKATANQNILPQTPITPPSGTVKTITIHFINVGHGDCILVQAGSYNMLIDTGFPRFAPEVVEYLKYHGVQQLETVIITHPHADHIGGLAEIIRTFPIKTLIIPNVTYQDPSYTAAMDAIAQKAIAVERPRVGMRFWLANALVTMLAPNSSKYIDLNNYSIVTRLTFGETSLLLTGDASLQSEAEMIANNSMLPLRSNLLKLAHHGGASSTTQAFLDMVHPQYAVISCANNEPLHFPSPVILNRLKAMGVKVYRTNQLGTIVVQSDGHRLEIK